MINYIQRRILLAYLVGVRHTDASIFTYNFKDETRRRFVLTTGETSLPMIIKTQKIFKQIFGRKVSISYNSKKV